MVAWNFANPKRKSHLISSQRNSSSFQIVRLIGILCSRKNSKKKLEEKLKKISKAKDYTKKLLQNCKSQGGPCTTFEELQKILKKKCDQDVHIVKTELACQAHTHKADKLGRPDLFRLNGISHEEKVTYLAILLSEYSISARTIADLPTNDDVIAVLEGSTTEQQSNEPSNLKVNHL